MILNELILENFGPYRNRQIFDLAPRQENGTKHPIILFGGKNGSGKTTLFEAINLCLYGPDAVGPGTTKKEYFEYVADKIHKNASVGDQMLEASVFLRFTNVHAGVRNEYVVQRSWAKKITRISENLSIHRNGEPLSDIKSDQWNTFIKELIPPGLAQLFFFDGEKIRKLSDANPIGQIYFADSVKALMGIDLIEQLERDIVVYSRRHVRKDDMKNLTGESEQLAKEKEEIENILKEHRQDRAQLETRIRREKSQIQALEEQIKNSGAEFYHKHEELKARKVQLTAGIAKHEEDIREMCAGLFPFALCGDLCRQLTERLRKETETLNIRKYRTLLGDHISQLTQALEKDVKSESLPRFSNLDINTISSYIKKKSTDLLNDSEIDFEPMLSDQLSQQDVENIYAWIGQAFDESAPKMRQYCKELEMLREKLGKVDLDLSRSPSEDILKPLFEKMSQLNRELGGLEQDAKRLDEKASNMAERIHQIEKRIAKIDESVLNSKNASDRLKLAARTKKVLSQFADRLLANKIRQIEAHIEKNVKVLCHKDDLIDKVSLDPERFSIALYDKQGATISKDRLSSGERQIFAIAMLRALRDISGRPIPVIIDTPLSRLDSDHRNNLIYEYFPNASHQTIILSTDTEINNGYYDGLKNHLSHAYYLKFNEKESRTVGEPGYFRQNGNEIKDEFKQDQNQQ